MNLMPHRVEADSEDNERIASPVGAGDQQWRELFEHNPAMYFMVDPAGSVRLVNSFGASQLGYGVGELVGRSLLDLVFVDDRELVRKNMLACLETPGRSHSWEARQVRKDKAVLWARQHAKAMRWSANELIVLLACEDITPRYGDQLELARLAAIVASSDDAIVSKSLGGIVTSWNDGATRIFGYDASEMIGQPIFRIIPPELHGEEVQILGRLQRGERIQHYETVRVAKDGRRIDISLTVSPLLDKSGAVVGASKVARDISEPKSAERELREGAARLRAVIETAVDGVILINARGVVLVFNPACEGLFDYSANEVIGQNVKMLMPDRYRQEHDGYISNYLATGDAKIIGSGREVVGRRKDGSTFPMNLSVGEAEQDGESIFVGIIHDLTESRRTETELQQARSDLARVARVTTLGELTAAIAHEVNQPLTGLVNSGNACLRWLAIEPPELDAARKSVERMISAGNRAADVITRIRALIAKSPPQQVPLNVNDAIAEAIALIEREAQRYSVSLQVDLSNEVPLVVGDRVQLQQVVLNLMLNAIEAMSDVVGRRRILSVSSARQGQDDVLISVRDSGSGLEGTSLDQLFEAFYTTKASGMGIGLAVSRTIVLAHGGRLWATPNQPHGAIFQFILPSAGKEAA
jgi:two-component system sensor kinase FixL